MFTEFKQKMVIKNMYKNPPPSISPLLVEEGNPLEFLQLLERTVNIISAYGSQHSIFHQAVSSVFAALQRLFEDVESISLSSSLEGWKFNGHVLSSQESSLKSLKEMFERFFIAKLSLFQGILEDEFVHLLAAFAEAKPDDFFQLISEDHFSHVKVEREPPPSSDAKLSVQPRFTPPVLSHEEQEEESHHSDTELTEELESLSALFEELDGMIKSNVSNENRIEDILELANTNLDDTVYSTREKLENLSRQLGGSEDTGTIDGQGTAMDRKELLSSISEISQELMQPLTAITTLLEMLLDGYAGDLNHEQHTMVTIASNSGEHLKFLMNELIDIVGYPVNKGVDDRFHTTSDQVVRKK